METARSRERGMRARSESSSRSRSNSITSTNRDRVQCFKCREYDHFANECPNLVPEDSDRESDGADWHHYRFWQIVIQVWK